MRRARRLIDPVLWWRMARNVVRPDSLTCEQWAQGIAAHDGARITLDEAEYLLWNETGFPGFFHRDDGPERTFAAQIHRFFRDGPCP